MAQYLKEEVRAAIEDAAIRIFAAHGYEAARMSDIAALADLSSGNLYRYFKNKDDLFHSVVDKRFAAKFLKLIRKRVRTLNYGLQPKGVQNNTTLVAEELLDFWIENRLKVVIILRGAKGSEYEDFRSLVVHELVRLAIAYMQKVGSWSTKTESRTELRFLFGVIFENTITAIVEILAEHQKDTDIRHLISKFWSYQLAGLAALFINSD